MSKNSFFNRRYRVTRYVVYKETLVDFKEHFWAFVGAFVGLGIIAFIQSKTLGDIENIFLIGSFGASSVLVFATIQSPLAQPRNLIGGHVISAFIGVTVYKFVPDIIWLTAPLAVALSIVVMQITKTLHPPGGAAAGCVRELVAPHAVCLPLAGPDGTGDRGPAAGQDPGRPARRPDGPAGGTPPV